MKRTKLLTENKSSLLNDILNEMAKTTMHNINDITVSITSDYKSEENKSLAQKILKSVIKAVDGKTKIMNISIKF